MNIEGFRALGSAIFETYMMAELLLSGRLVPLKLMPNWAESLANWLPFKWTFYFPIEVLVGNMSTASLLGGLGIDLPVQFLVDFCDFTGWEGTHSYGPNSHGESHGDGGNAKGGSPLGGTALCCVDQTRGLTSVGSEAHATHLVSTRTRRSSLFGLAHDEMPQHLFGDLQRRLELRDPIGVELKVLENVGPLLLVLDLIGELALAPEVGALDRAA